MAISFMSFMSFMDCYSGPCLAILWNERAPGCVGSDGCEW